MGFVQLLESRVIEYSKTYKIEDMCALMNYLKETYPEDYKRVKNNILINQIHKIIEKHNLQDNIDDDLNSKEAENELKRESKGDEIIPNKEKMNQDLRNLYNKNTTNLKPSSEEDIIKQMKNINKRRNTDTIIENSENQEKKPKTNKIQKHLKLSDKTASMATIITEPKPIKYADLGGFESVIKDIKELVEYPLKYPEIYTHLGVEPVRGILLHGPPGCGKTALANAIAHECKVPFFKVSAPEIIAGISGESEAKIRNLFKEAMSLVPSIIFIDEIDSIAGKREGAQKEMERRIVAQLLTCMDEISNFNDKSNELTVYKHLVVIGATNRPDVLDPALRRAGRFDREIALGIPSESSRIKILSVLCKKLKLEGDFDFKKIARSTPGFVGADLEALTKEAAALAINRIFSEIELENFKSTELNKLSINMIDFEKAIEKVQPSLKREGFSTRPDINWNDIGALEDIREELNFAITKPIMHPEYFESLNITFSSGVMLFGPPGCGKTLVAKAVANEAKSNFISIKGPELLSKYVGESERGIRQLFSRARAAKPCVLFFDEMDALAPKRGTGNDNQASERVVNQLLTEIDGVESREGVYLIAATNRIDIIDNALLRPGRFDKILYVPLPDNKGKLSILKTITKKIPIDTKIELKKIVENPLCQGFSGADLAGLVKEASILALKEKLLNNCNSKKFEVGEMHFDKALLTMKPSVSKLDLQFYEKMKKSYYNAI